MDDVSSVEVAYTKSSKIKTYLSYIQGLTVGQILATRKMLDEEQSLGKEEGKQESDILAKKMQLVQGTFLYASNAQFCFTSSFYLLFVTPASILEEPSMSKR